MWVVVSRFKIMIAVLTNSLIFAEQLKNENFRNIIVDKDNKRWKKR